MLEVKENSRVLSVVLVTNIPFARISECNKMATLPVKLSLVKPLGKKIKVS